MNIKLKVINTQYINLELNKLMVKNLDESDVYFCAIAFLQSQFRIDQNEQSISIIKIKSRIRDSHSIFFFPHHHRILEHIRCMFKDKQQLLEILILVAFYDHIQFILTTGIKKIKQLHDLFVCILSNWWTPIELTKQKLSVASHKTVAALHNIEEHLIDQKMNKV